MVVGERCNYLLCYKDWHIWDTSIIGLRGEGAALPQLGTACVVSRN